MNYVYKCTCIWNIYPEYLFLPKIANSFVCSAIWHIEDQGLHAKRVKHVQQT